MSDDKLAQLLKLREPFEKNQISQLPKPYKKGSPKGHCDTCGGYHGLPAVHLDYVGHAALTDRLLDVDPFWNWEPLNTVNKLPLLDEEGGMWIKLTVCGVTRLGYGDAQGKKGANATKERIGDALRNAAMRFGAALNLWHKGDLHVSGNDAGETQELHTAKQFIKYIQWFVDEGKRPDELDKWIEGQTGHLSPVDQESVSKAEKEAIEKLEAIHNPPPETYTCPQGGRKVPKSECNECPAKAECELHTGEL